ncbi:hypothetical protein ACIKQA_19555, partial [Acinetobacter baumannii]|uniref:hypothetical protein n=1 Tax=Acinetobacter baumannii TaxID=470 RepID=UPI0037CE4299
ALVRAQIRFSAQTALQHRATTRPALRPGGHRSHRLMRPAPPQGGPWSAWIADPRRWLVRGCPAARTAVPLPGGARPESRSRSSGYRDR